MNDRPPRDRWLLILGFCWVFFFVASVLFLTAVPIEPAIGYFFFVAAMLCILVSWVAYSYRAWTMNADEFAEWLVAQSLFGVGASWTEFKIEFFSKEWYLWSTRLSGPLAVVLILVGLVLFTLSVIAGGVPL
jgi:hypothetical protein